MWQRECWRKRDLMFWTRANRREANRTRRHQGDMDDGTSNQRTARHPRGRGRRRAPISQPNKRGSACVSGREQADQQVRTATTGDLSGWEVRCGLETKLVRAWPSDDSD